MGDAYPELRANRDTIEQTSSREEERFEAVLTEGLPRLEELLDRAASAPGAHAPGRRRFRLYDTFGVPFDFIEDLAGERQLAIDRDGFERAMEGQREQGSRRQRVRRQKKEAAFTDASDSSAALEQTRRSLRGLHDHARRRAADGGALRRRAARRSTALADGATGFVVAGRTPFYLEAGGQVSDTGTIGSEHGAAATVDGWSGSSAGVPRAHRVRVESAGCAATAATSSTADGRRRRARCDRRNHTATHLLHAALRQVLGPHVKQAGSLVAPDRLRFDFVQPSAIAPTSSTRIERIVNERDLRNTPVHDRGAADRRGHCRRRHGALRREVRRHGPRGLDPGLQPGAVRRHALRATGDIGLFAITSGGGVAAGVRRDRGGDRHGRRTTLARGPAARSTRVLRR